MQGRGTIVPNLMVMSMQGRGTMRILEEEDQEHVTVQPGVQPAHKSPLVHDLENHHDLWKEIRAAWTEVLDGQFVQKNIEGQVRGRIISAWRLCQGIGQLELESGGRDLVRTVSLKRPAMLGQANMPSKSSTQQAEKVPAVAQNTLQPNEVATDPPSCLRGVLPITPSAFDFQHGAQNSDLQGDDVCRIQRQTIQHTSSLGSLTRKIPHHRRIRKKQPYTAHQVAFGAQEPPLVEEEFEDFDEISPLEVSDSTPSSQWWKHVKIKPPSNMYPGGRSVAAAQERAAKAMEQSRSSMSSLKLKKIEAEE